MENVDTLIDAYIDQTIDDEQFAALCDWLREDAEHRQTFARKLALHSEIAEWCTERSGSSLAGSLDTPEAEADLPTIHIDAEKLTKQKYAAAMSYVLRHTFTPKRFKTLAVAAAMLLGVVLAVVMLTGPEDGEEIAETPGPAVSNDTLIVATLTGEHDAVWDRQPGEDLFAAQRLTLTAGFAEITTASGAIAILEAPTTIELSDSPNTIRLYAGKLLGICESDSAKGLVVRTAHANITDLGTHFGVIAEQASTTVSVLEGEVQLDSALLISPAIHLTTNEAASVNDQGIRPLDNAAQINPSFAALLQRKQFKQLTANGQIKLLTQAPESLAYGQFIDYDHLQLFCERRGVVLSDALAVDVKKPGRFNSNEYEPTPSTLPGLTVDSYMLFASRTTDKPSWKAEITQLKASITFDRPIVGLIGLTQSLHASDEVLGLDEVNYEQRANRGILKEGNAIVQDFIEISEDQKTLTIDCKVVGVDQLRILIQANDF